MVVMVLGDDGLVVGNDELGGAVELEPLVEFLVCAITTNLKEYLVFILVSSTSYKVTVIE